VWFSRLLETRWRLAIAPLSPADCATTCLLAGWTSDSGLTTAALGDGIILLREAGQTTRILSTRPDGYALNETLALGCDHRLSDWSISQLEPVAPWAVVLATDGVADDLDPARLEQFMDWLVNEIAPLPPHQRRIRLREALRKWPTPGHSDDKSIAVLISQ